MKNLHVLPTDKPSRVYKHLGRELKHTVRYFEQKGLLCINQNIYITNDEEIKDGDYGLSKLNEIVKFHSGYDYRYYAKIILTTDQDLDGIQAIDHEFLEWFVENPSCEEIKVELHEVSFLVPDNIYKIIIPQEEPKQETLEEAAERLYQKGLKDDLSLSFHDGVKFGAEWQAERMYSEEDMKKAFIEGHNVCRCVTDNTDEAKECFNNWFEQFKKK